MARTPWRRLPLVGLSLAIIATTWSSTAEGAAVATPDWPTFQHDTMHTGVSPDTSIGATRAPALSPKWSQLVGGGPVYASPVVVKNVRLGKTLVFDVGVGGTVHAFDTSGASIWTQSVGPSAVLDTPTVNGNTLYVGNDGGQLVALDATTGAIQCSYQLPIVAPETTPGRIESSPVVRTDSTGPVVYFGDTGQSEAVNRGHEWAINGVGNTAGACTVKWSFNGFPGSGKRTGSWSPPAIGTDSTGRPLIVFGSSQPDDAVYALDARDGSLVWRFQTSHSFADADVGAGPTISSPGTNGFANGVVYVDGKNRIEFAIDMLTGQQLWSFDMKADSGLSANSVSSAALVGNLVVVAYAKYVYAFNAITGAKIWRTAAATGNYLASVSVSGAPGHQVALIGDSAGTERAYRLSDGVQLFALRVGSKIGINASTAIAGSMAFFAADDGRLYALG